MSHRSEGVRLDRRHLLMLSRLLKIVIVNSYGVLIA